MSESSVVETVPPAKAPPSRGCLWLAILPLWFVLLGGWMWWHLRGEVQEMRTFMDAQARPLHPLQPTAEELTALRSRLTAFAALIEKNETATLELSIDDLNRLLGGQEPVNRLKELIKVSAIDEAIHFDVSLAINGMPMSGERLYLNGEMTARTEVVRGTGPVLITKTLEVPGKPVSEGFRGKYLEANHLDTLLMSEVRDDAALSAIMKKITTVRTDTGKVIVEFVPASGAPASRP